MFFVGGILPYLLYDSYRRGRIQCENCGLVFRPVQRLTKGDFIFVFLVLAALLAVVGYILLAADQ